MSTRSMTRISRNRYGYGIRFAGRGTLRESPAVHAFARQVLDDEPGPLFLDLSACDYLDSTFLGALVDLQRRYGRADPARFLVVAREEVSKRLFGPNCLEAFFRYTDDFPEPIGAELELSTPAPGRDDLGRHILDCHRRLAEIGGPNQAAMQGVVELLSVELLTH